MAGWLALKMAKGQEGLARFKSPWRVWRRALDTSGNAVMCKTCFTRTTACAIMWLSPAADRGKGGGEPSSHPRTACPGGQTHAAVSRSSGMLKMAISQVWACPDQWVRRCHPVPTGDGGLARAQPYLFCSFCTATAEGQLSACKEVSQALSRR